MKTFTLRLRLSLTLFVTGLSLSSSSQQNIQGISDTLIRPTPIIGFNSNGHFGTLNWTNQQFIDSVAVLNAGIIRYPGGTNSNYWDWQAGWWFPSFAPPYPWGPLTVRPEEFQNGLNASNAEGLFVLNYRNSTLSYQMAGLRHVDSLGMNIGYIEIGNEHNLNQGPDPNQYVPPSIYGLDCKIWCDSIKNQFPNAKICLVGGVPPTVLQWHDSILYFNPNMDAFSFHVYPSANDADLVFNVTRSLADPFNTLPTRFTQAKFNLLPDSIDVWVTEYALWETQFASQPVIANTWTHSLFTTAMNHVFLENKKITMLINHSLGSIQKFWQAVDSMDYHITANGVAMRLLLDVAKTSDTAQRIIFSPSPTLTYGTTTYAKLNGWKFSNSTAINGFICNLSADTFKLSLENVFTNPMQFDEYYGDTALIVNGLESINKYSGNSTDSIFIYPFSITQIYTSPTTDIQVQKTTNNNGLWIYPNPSQNDITIQTDLSMTNAEVIIYSMTGQVMERLQNVSGQKVKISTDRLIRGTYFITIKNNNQLVTGKFIMD